MNHFTGLSVVVKVVVIGFAAMCITCGASSEAARETLTELEAEIAVKEGNLTKLNEEIAHAECCSTKANIEARVTRLRTDCFIEVAGWDRCAEKKKKGKGSLLGCLGGIGALAGTFGVSTVVTLAQCKAVLDASSLECQVPECAKKLDQIEQQVFTEMGLDGWPRCACKEDGAAEK